MKQTFALLAWLLAGLGGCSWWCASTLAQSAAPPGSEENPAYKSAIDAALQEYELQHYDEARSLFARAHAIDPSARTLRGLGMVEFERRHYVLANELLEQALASPKKPLTDAQRSAVEALLVRTKQFIARYVVDARPASAELRLELDGKPLTLDAEHGFSTDPGEHKLRVLAPRELALALDAQGGEVQTLPIDLGPQASVPAVRDSEPAPAERPHSHRLAIALTSAGGAILTGSAVLGSLALVKAGDAPTRDSSEAHHAHHLAIATDVTIGVGVATAVTGVVLWLVQRKRHDRPADARASRVETAFPHLKVSF